MRHVSRAFACLFLLSSISIYASSAPTHDELVQFRFSQSTALIQSEEDLAEHLNALETINSPLLYLSETARKEFVDSIVWTDAGVASFSALPLELELTVTEAYQVLQLFGLESVVDSLKTYVTVE